jgi:hypothetical protein
VVGTNTSGDSQLKVLSLGEALGSEVSRVEAERSDMLADIHGMV